MTPAQIESVFGRSRLKMDTGEHVEVFREAVAPGERRRYTKRFLATGDADFGQWTEREWRILARLIGHGIRCVPDVVQFDGGAMGGVRLVQTYDAGVTVDQWATLLPVTRGNRLHRHVFEDCAHWWALAHYCIAALDEIHSLQLVHLDIKGDNICIPYGPATFDPESSDRLHPIFSKLALIDFAFSLVSRENLATPLPIGWQKDYDYQSPRLLKALDAGRNGDMQPTKELDWRCDLYSLAAMLRRYLPGSVCGDETGWTLARHDDARKLIFRLRECHDRDMPYWRPHQQLLEFTGAQIGEGDLAASLDEGWTLASVAATDSAATPITPMTRIAPSIRSVQPIRIPTRIIVPTAVTAVMRDIPPAAPRRRPWQVLVLAPAIGAFAALATPSFIGDPEHPLADSMREALDHVRTMFADSPADLAMAKPEPQAAVPPTLPAQSPAVETPAAAPAAPATVTQVSPQRNDIAEPPPVDPAPALAGEPPAVPPLPPAVAATQPLSENAANGPQVKPDGGASLAMRPHAASSPRVPKAHAPPPPAASRAKRQPESALAATAPAKHSAPRAAALASSRGPTITYFGAESASQREARVQESKPQIYAQTGAPVAPGADPPASAASAVTDSAVAESSEPSHGRDIAQPNVAAGHAATADPGGPAVSDRRPPPLGGTAPTGTAEKAAGEPPLAPSGATTSQRARVAENPHPSGDWRKLFSNLGKLLRGREGPPAPVEDRTALAAAPRSAPQAPPPPAPPARETVARPSDRTQDPLLAQGRRMLADTVPRVAAQAQLDVSRVLRVAAVANHRSQQQAILDAAYSAWPSESAWIPVTEIEPARARQLHDDARRTYAAGRMSDAIDLELRALGANPRDPDIAAYLAMLHMRKNPVQAETARQLAMYAIVVSAERRSARSGDWATLAIASALAGRGSDATQALLVEVALTADFDRSCQTAQAAYARFGERLRLPVQAMLDRAYSNGRVSPYCEWPNTSTAAAGWQ